MAQRNQRLRQSIKLLRNMVILLLITLVAVQFMYIQNLNKWRSIAHENQEYIFVLSEYQDNMAKAFEQEIKELEAIIENLRGQVDYLEEANPFLMNPADGVILLGDFTATAYDLSVQSCGKPMGHPAYGITRSGYDLSHHSWDTARTIAVDPNLIPLGTKVLISFEDEAYQKYNGVYTARDTGGAIKGRRIDFFMGDFQQYAAHPKAMQFGVRKVKIAIINDDMV